MQVRVADPPALNPESHVAVAMEPVVLPLLKSMFPFSRESSGHVTGGMDDTRK